MSNTTITITATTNLKQDQRWHYLQQFGSNSLAFSSLQDGMDFFMIRGFGYLPYLKVKTSNTCVNQICLSDPICSLEKKPVFLQWCVETLKNLHFVHISRDTAKILHRLGFSINEIGVETIIDVQKFSLIGTKKSFLRSQRNRAQKHGIKVFEVYGNTISKDNLFSISNDWMRNKTVSNGELSFITRPMVYADEPGVRKFYATKNGDIVGFVIFDPVYQEGKVTGYLANILRTNYKASCSIVDFIILEALEQFKYEGIKELSLGFSPFYDINDTGEFRFNKLLQVFFRFLFNYASFLYNFKELAFHKSRYRPGIEGVREERVYYATRSVFPLALLYALFCTMGFHPISQALKHCKAYQKKKLVLLRRMLYPFPSSMQYFLKRVFAKYRRRIHLIVKA